VDPRFTYTSDDQMQPVYCPDCRAHIPRTVLSQFGNVCPNCHQRRVALVNAPAPAAMPIQPYPRPFRRSSVHPLIWVGVGCCGLPVGAFLLFGILAASLVSRPPRPIESAPAPVAPMVSATRSPELTRYMATFVNAFNGAGGQVKYLSATATDLAEIERRVKAIAAALDQMTHEANRDTGGMYWKHVPTLTGRF
jgi:hypothetical protein